MENVANKSVNMIYLVELLKVNNCINTLKIIEIIIVMMYR